MTAQVIVWTVEGYFAVGALVALAFVAFGVARVDEAAKGSSIAFRALIVPGCAALWPLVLLRWARGRPASTHPEESKRT